MFSKNIHIKTECLQKINSTIAREYNVIPYSYEDDRLKLFSNSFESKETLEIILGQNVEIEIINQQDLNYLLNKYYRKSDNDKTLNLNVKNNSNFIQSLISEARNTGSSDIHIEALEEKCRVRLRIDGKLIERIIINKEDYAEIINKIKILANLDIAEKRLPQDGRIDFDFFGEKFDLRISVLPSMFGEKIVMRILGSDASSLNIEDLGFSEVEKTTYLRAIQKTSGIILISGPTGSGKTTTLYATLNFLNKIESNILTIEDPIEYTLAGINQVQLRESIGLTFPKALRTFLRQDPDIIMVGEIRDKETAEMAIRASLTGHLVLSTIHTNSAIGTINRLIDMGIPEFLVSDTLVLSLSQRLIRLLCNFCKEESSINLDKLPLSFELNTNYKVYEPVGCEKCHFTGFKGRKAVIEMIELDETIKNSIKYKKNIQPKINQKTLADNCLEQYLSGNTSFDEIYPYLLSL